MYFRASEAVGLSLFLTRIGECIAYAYAYCDRKANKTLSCGVSQSKMTEPL